MKKNPRKRIPVGRLTHKYNPLFLLIFLLLFFVLGIVWYMSVKSKTNLQSRAENGDFSQNLPENGQTLLPSVTPASVPLYRCLSEDTNVYNSPQVASGRIRLIKGTPVRELRKVQDYSNWSEITPGNLYMENLDGKLKNCEVNPQHILQLRELEETAGRIDQKKFVAVFDKNTYPFPEKCESYVPGMNFDSDKCPVFMIGVNQNLPLLFRGFTGNQLQQIGEEMMKLLRVRNYTRIVLSPYTLFDNVESVYVDQATAIIRSGIWSMSGLPVEILSFGRSPSQRLGFFVKFSPSRLDAEMYPYTFLSLEQALTDPYLQGAFMIAIGKALGGSMSQMQLAPVPVYIDPQLIRNGGLVITIGAVVYIIATSPVPNPGDVVAASAILMVINPDIPVPTLAFTRSGSPPLDISPTNDPFWWWPIR